MLRLAALCLLPALIPAVLLTNLTDTDTDILDITVTAAVTGIMAIVAGTAVLMAVADMAAEIVAEEEVTVAAAVVVMAVAAAKAD